MNKLSIIIPVLNEISTIATTIAHLEKVLSKKIAYEIIIVDGGSIDGTIEKIKANDALKLVLSKKGRAKQMNTGANSASGDILYFLHCDSFPPQDFDLAIISQVSQGNKAGCFRMEFNDNHPVLRLSQWFTRINHIAFRGGDQSLFVTTQLFQDIKGFNEEYVIYEDNDIISRLYAKKQFVVIPLTLFTSSRRYRQNGVWRLQYHFAMIHFKRKLGHSPEQLLNYYKQNIL
ncbi:TIGR04283 family arsenosugar biosynthesis glycosyltransferase [Flavobacterium sp. PL002]|uniref:TIGR04283 family arsenosugar biosynthesis glycosyltransferase n=1 Tax=Flavobacterium sp. PL002 TaxID=1897058 RepID=UPI001787EBD0|nr:TIGR04283 family arsenosugar biosynthesis glycosyltransferase [Flavobacterium sp. PL002]MBE0393839.1 Undecaprenyl-phosphate 4-deoxy-4-formamido-L-arabinose transferase [Flavobacterium sp. PL002]